MIILPIPFTGSAQGLPTCKHCGRVEWPSWIEVVFILGALFTAAFLFVNALYVLFYWTEGRYDCVNHECGYTYHTLWWEIKAQVAWYLALFKRIV